MAEYSTSFDRSGGYSFDQQAITDLWKQAREHTGKDADIDVTLEGSHNIRMTAIDEFFDDAFVKNNFIEKISISSRNYSQTPSKAISVALRIETFMDAVSVSISGDRTDCSARLAEITSIVEGQRLWYSRYIFSSASWLGAVTLGLLSGMLGSTASSFIEKYSGKELPILLNGLLLGGTFVMLAIIVGFFKRQMFPKLVFEIGKSSGRGISATYWRNVIGVGIIIALTVGIVGGLVVEHIK